MHRVQLSAAFTLIERVVVIARPLHSRRVNVSFADNHAKPYAKFNPAELMLSYSQPGVAFY